MKKILLLTSIFSLFSFITKAQFIPNTTIIHTPMGNIPITSYYHIPHIYFNSTNKSSVKTLKDYFLVKLKNDSTLKVYGKIDISGNKNKLVVKEKKQVRYILPEETVYIAPLGEYYSRTQGFANDSCWVFLQTNGFLTTYSILPEKDDIYAVFYKKREDDNYYVINETNLLELAEGDENIIKIIKKLKDYSKAIKAINKKHL